MNDPQLWQQVDEGPAKFALQQLAQVLATTTAALDALTLQVNALPVLTSAFRAYRNNALTLASGNQTIVFDTTEYDTLGEFNTATGTWTPTVSGKYLITAGIALNTSQPDGTIITVQINQAGGRSRYLYLNGLGAGVAPSFNGGDVFKVTAGETYTVQIGGHINNSAIFASTSGTWFDAIQLR